MKQWKKLLCLNLALIMLISTLPLRAFAEGAEEEPLSSEEETGVSLAFCWPVPDSETGEIGSEESWERETVFLEEGDPVTLAGVGADENGVYTVDGGYVFLGWTSDGCWYDTVTADMDGMELYAAVEEKPEEPYFYLIGHDPRNELFGRTGGLWGDPVVFLEAEPDEEGVCILPEGLFCIGYDTEQLVWWDGEEQLLFGQQVMMPESGVLRLWASYSKEIPLYLDEAEEIFACVEVMSGGYWDLPDTVPVRDGQLFSSWFSDTDGWIMEGDYIWDVPDALYARWETVTDGRILAVSTPDVPAGEALYTAQLRSYQIRNDYLKLLSYIPERILESEAVVTGFRLKEDGSELALDVTTRELAEGTGEGEALEVELISENLGGEKTVVYYGVRDYEDTGIHSGDDEFGGESYFVQKLDADAEEFTLADTYTFTCGSDRVVYWSSGSGEYLPGETALWPEEAGDVLIAYANYGQQDMVPINFYDWLWDYGNDGLTSRLNRELRAEGGHLGSSDYERTPTGTYRDGSLFMGWNTEEDGSGQWYAPFDTVTADMAELDLYAILAEPPQTTYLYLCGLTNDFSYLTGTDEDGRHYQVLPVTAGEDGAVTLPGALFRAANGAVQTGWRDSYGAEYALGASVPLTEGGLTLYAAYGFSLTLDFNFDGADPRTVKVELPPNGYWDLNSYAPERSGYRLSAWTTDAAGEGKDIFGAFSFENGIVPENTVLYAQWEPDKSNAQVIFREYASGKTPDPIAVSYYSASGGSLQRYMTLREASPYQNTDERYMTGFKDAKGKVHPVNATLWDLVPAGTVGEFTLQWETPDEDMIVYYAGYGSDSRGRVYQTQTLQSGRGTLKGSGTFNCIDPDAKLLYWWDAAAEKSYELGASVRGVNGVLSLDAVYGVCRMTYYYNLPEGLSLDIKSDTEAMLYTSSSRYKNPRNLLRDEPGWLFLGWNTKADGTGRWYTPLDSVSFQSPAALYGQWMKLPETGTYYVLATESAGYTFDGKLYQVIGETDVLPETLNGRTVFSWGGRYPGETLAGEKNGAQVTLIPYLPENNFIYGELDGNGGTDSSGREKLRICNFSVVSGGNLEAYLEDYEFTREGYELLWWQTESGAVYTGDARTKEVLREETPEGGGIVKLTAQWMDLAELEGGAVAYIGNGGAAGDGSLYQVRASEDGTAVKNFFSCPEKRFLGWNTASDGEGDWYDPGEEIGEDVMMLYAIWGHTRLTYRYGSGKSVVVHQRGDAAADLTKGRSGVFRGWQLPDGSFYLGDRECIPDDAPAQLELTGVWYTERELSRAADAGRILLRTDSGSIRLGGVNYGTVAIFDAFDGPLPAVSGKEFAGWSTAELPGLKDFVTWICSDTPGEGTVTEAGTDVTLQPGTTLWAVNYPHVTYHGNGGVYASDSVSEAVVYMLVASDGDLVELFDGDSFRKNGAPVKIWNTEADGSGDYWEVGLETRDWEDLPGKLYAVYETVSLCQVEFWSEGEQIASGQRAAGKAVGILPAPTREGYLFDGWYTEAGVHFTEETVLPAEGTLKLYARWIFGETGTLGDEDEVLWLLDRGSGQIRLQSAIPAGSVVCVACYRDGRMISAAVLTSTADRGKISDRADTVVLFWLDGDCLPLCTQREIEP